MRALDVGKTTEHKAIDFADVLNPCPTFFVGVGAHAITATADVELGNPTLGVVAAAFAGALHVEGADLRVAVAVAVVAPGVYAIVADLAGEGFHLLGAGDSGGEGCGAKLHRTVAVLFGLLKEGEPDLLTHLLLLAQHAGVFALIAGGELGGDCTLDRAGFNVLGAIPTAAFALHCADVFLGIGDAGVVHAPKWAWGFAEMMSVGVYLIGNRATDDVLIFHNLMSLISYIGGNGRWGYFWLATAYTAYTAYRKMEKKKGKNRHWPTKNIGNIEQKKMRYPSRAAHGSKSSYRNDQ